MTKRTWWAAFTIVLTVGVAWADDWPQWRGPRRDGVWRETGIVERLPAKLDFQWRAKIGGGYAGPAVANGRVFVADRILDQGERNPDNPFSAPKLGGKERVLCLDAQNGNTLWTHEYPCRYQIQYAFGPRATPTVHGGKVYTIGAMGHFYCLDEKTGTVLWSKDYVEDFGTTINIWGMSAAPLIDGDKVILLAGGANNACVVALDKITGKEIWRSLYASDPGYSAPVIVEAGGRRQLIVWNPVGLYSLDPESGKVYWEQPFALRAGLSIPTPIHDPERGLLFVTAFYNGPLMMQLAEERPAARLLWKGKSDSELPKQTDGLHAIMCTPVFQGGYIYGVCSYGQLRCVDAQTGKRLWETRAATGDGRWWNAFIVRHAERYILFNEQGELIIAKFSPQGYEENSRAFLIAPTNPAQRRKVVWSHPAFANRCVYARNDGEIVCANLAAE